MSGTDKASLLLESKQSLVSSESRRGGIDYTLARKECNKFTAIFNLDIHKGNNTFPVI